MKRNIVTFDGPGPFDLPRAKNVAIRRRGNAVVFSFEVPMSPNRSGVVRIAVLSSLARKLAASIIETANRIDAAKK